MHRILDDTEYTTFTVTWCHVVDIVVSEENSIQESQILEYCVVDEGFRCRIHTLPSAISARRKLRTIPDEIIFPENRSSKIEKSIIAWEESHRKIKDDIYIPRTYQQHLKNQLYLNGVWNLSSSSEPFDIYIYLYGNPVEIRRDNHTSVKTVSDALVTYVSAINY